MYPSNDPQRQLTRSTHQRVGAAQLLALNLRPHDHVLSRVAAKTVAHGLGHIEHEAHSIFRLAMGFSDAQGGELQHAGLERGTRLNALEAIERLEARLAPIVGLAGRRAELAEQASLIARAARAAYGARKLVRFPRDRVRRSDAEGG